MSDEIENYGLLKLPPEIRAKGLARIGMTEQEYREKAKLEIQRNSDHAAAEKAGETVHGWSAETDNPGWSDDKIVGQVTESDPEID